MHLPPAWANGGQPANHAPSSMRSLYLFTYAAASRVLEVHFTKPLERFRTVKVELLEGILGTDAQPLKPWTLTFAVGGP